ncbi:MAG: SHIRT domain-containing protein [Carnobacterium sp.]|nr:SHIRT domain-containing protein [Carnobacterium sp.]
MDFNSKKKYILIAKTVSITATLALGAAVVPSTLVGHHNVVAEEAAAPTSATYKVEYVFESDTTGQELPEGLKQLAPKDTATYATGKTVTASAPSKELYAESNTYPTVPEGTGYWVFQGYDADSKEVTDGNVTFTGKWKFYDYVNITYKLVNIVDPDNNVRKEFAEIPAALSKLNLSSTRKLSDFLGENRKQLQFNIDNSSIFEIEEVDRGGYTETIRFIIDDVEEGKWVYSEPPITIYYSLEDDINDDQFVGKRPDVVTDAAFTFVANSRTPKYEFVSGTEGKTLPATIVALTPEDTTEYVYHNRHNYAATDKVVAKTPSQTTYYDSENKGTWTFTGYDYSEMLLNNWDKNGWDLKFVGTWTFKADEEETTTTSEETTSGTTETQSEAKTSEAPEAKKSELPNTGTTDAQSTGTILVGASLIGLGMYVLRRKSQEN